MELQEFVRGRWVVEGGCSGVAWGIVGWLGDLSSKGDCMRSTRGLQKGALLSGGRRLSGICRGLSESWGLSGNVGL